MKKWNAPELATINLLETENGRYEWCFEIDPACWNLYTGTNPGEQPGNGSHEEGKTESGTTDDGDVTEIDRLS